MKFWMTLLKLCVFLASNFGYWEFFRRRLNLRTCFLPAFTAAAQFCVLFIAGLLNYLGEAADLMYFGGLVLLLAELWQEKGNLWKLCRPYLQAEYALALIALAAAVLAVHGKHLSAIDNFTHWAVVIRNMLYFDRFPTFAQEAVTFTSYPVGSAALVYYFCRRVGDTEWMFMLAQTYLMLCMMLPLFAGLKKHRAVGAVLIAVMVNFFLCYNIPVTELLVDTLLPLTAAAAFLFVADTCCSEEKPMSVLYALPLLFLTMNIKNSGPFFVAVGLLPALLRKGKQREDWKALALTVLVLLAGYSLWNRHCDYVFANSRMSQHAVSAAYFQMRLAERTPAELLQIARGVTAYVCSRKALVLLGLWLAVLAAGIWLLHPTQGRKSWLRLALLNFGVYATWSISLLGMYLFSMSVQEALELTSIERYARSIDIFLLFLNTAYALSLMDGAETGTACRLFGLALAALMTVTWAVGCNGFPCFPAVREGDLTVRSQIEDLVAEYGVERGYSYLICDRVAGGYAMFALRYCMNTSRVQQIAVTEEAQMELEKQYDYVFLLDPDNPILQDWVARAYPAQAGRQVIRCIK